MGAGHCLTLAVLFAFTVCAPRLEATVGGAVITIQPAPQAVQDGQAATFSVVATGTAPLAYQWRVDGVAIGGANAASYTTPATRLPESGARYSVAVSNGAGTAISQDALLTVNSYTGARYFSLIVEAVASASPPSITLKWAYQPENRQYRIYRKGYADGTWTLMASFAATAASLQWTDTAVRIGTPYEYRIERDIVSAKYGAGTLSDNLCGGIDVPPVDDRGTVLLLVDGTVAAPLRFELERLQDDLVADGWQVKRHDVARGPLTGGTAYAYDAAAVAAVKGVITADYHADPARVRSVFLVGHVPVPYSGDTAWDGHTGHKGAWACDLYYADVDGAWTDATVNLTTTVTNPENVNVPGDGKPDQAYAPSAPELEIGRVDLSNLPAFLPKTEIDLLRQYLDKDHAHRQAAVAFGQQGIVEDYFFDDYLAAMGWDAWASLFGKARVSRGTMADDLTGEQSYAGYYLCGPGSVNSCWRLTTATWAALDPKAQFCYLFGSWFGDWDKKDDFLRAPLAAGHPLASLWSIDPTYLMGRAALGGSFGEIVRISGDTGLYHNNWTGDPAYSGFIALMGDPTLRLLSVAPPSHPLVAVGAGNHPALSWTASPDGPLLGYHVYRAAIAAGPFARVTTAPVAATTYTDGTVTSGTWYYQVKAAKRETTAGGTYVNLSHAVTVAYPPPAGGTLAFSAATYRQPEGDSGTANAIVTVTRTGGSAGAASVRYATSAGTATGGSDYTEASGTLSWAAGDATAKTFAVAIIGDRAVENDETVNLALSAASGASLGADAAQVVIANDDAGKPGTIEFASASYAQVEGNAGIANAVVTLTRLGGSYGPVSARLVVGSDGTATLADRDYVTGSITVAWTNGQAGSIQVNVGSSYGTNVGIVGDTRAEPDEYLTMSLSAPTGGATLGLDRARLVILNDDGAPAAPTILVQPADQTIYLGTRPGRFAVVASGVPVPTCQWTRNGTPIAGATAATYTTPAQTLVDSGAVYRVVVTNSAGSVTSAPAVLTVKATATPPVILVQPADATVNVGRTAAFQVVVGSPETAVLTYQWRRNGVDIVGANGSGYRTPPTAAGDTGAVYSVVVGNGAVTTTSANAVLTVAAGTTTPQAITGFNAFGAHAYGDAPFTIAGVAGGGSGNPVVFTSSDPAVATVMGATVTIVGAGSATISADQVGNAGFSAAPTARQVLISAQAPLRVVANAATRAFGAGNPVFTGTLSGVVNGDAITAVYASSATATTTVGVYGPATPEAVTPTLVDPAGRLGNYAVTRVLGTLTITASAPPAPGAPSVANPSSATPTISGTTVPNATVTVFVDDAAFGTTTANGAGAWTYTPAGPLAEGSHQVSVAVATAAGTSTRSPIVALLTDAQLPTFATITIQLDGTVRMPVAALTVNGEAITPATDGSWSSSVAIPIGITPVSVVARDASGTVTRTIYLTRSTGG